MKHNIYIIGIAIAFILALHGCGQDAPDAGKRDNALEKDIREAEAAFDAEQDTVLQPLGNLADIHHPDMKIRVRKGNTLHLETDGFQLMAVDTAVMHTREYSVTSLLEEDLAPLPQGMKNMTAATAGYRLLPSGEHFSPYAELRVAYDPARLPLGYTPEDIYTSYYDTVNMAWVRLERLYIDTVSHEIVSATTHFTDFINELLKAPEMPETQAFVPTQMSDLEAVNPLDGKPLMQPPTANAEGTANLSYPIWTPAGRAGMQPNLVLTYNSAGGNGWLGVGWDISVPAITLDTRWGVPRYNEDYETEIYLYGGEQLVTKDNQGHMNPMPHRTNQQTPRLPSETQFFARTGNAHDSIIRHNGGTDDYWWEIVDRTGTTHYYGHYPVNEMNDRHPSTLTDQRGNIARWMLCESRDPYGNWIRYFYDTVLTGGTNPGIQIYLDSISYTGYSDREDGIYSVVFKRKRRDFEDRPVNCNNGFKEETGDYLTDIYVKTRDTIINHYSFQMECTYNTNFKYRLASFTKEDKLNNRYIEEELMNDVYSGKTRNLPCGVTQQFFEYYDMPSMNTLFDTVKRMNVGSNNLVGFMLTPGFRFTGVNNATALGLSHTSGWSVSGTLGAGIGFRVWNTDMSIGGNYRRGENCSESLMTLVDLDGDGLADKVFVKDGQMYWRKRQWTPDGNISYDSPCQIRGANHFLVEESTTNTFGVQAAVSVASGSGAWSNSVSTTPTYFADVDGDGLMDIVDGGNILFNILENGQPAFKEYKLPFPHAPDEPHITSTACGGIIFDGEVDGNAPCRIVWGKPTTSGPMSKEQALAACHYTINGNIIEKVEANDSVDGYYTHSYTGVIDCSQRNLSMSGEPTTEAVRVWVAPDSGTAELKSYVRLLEDRSVKRALSRHADGVTYTIQLSHIDSAMTNDTLHSTKDSLIMSRDICAGCYGTNNFNGFNYDSIHTFQINRGDIIFFRLQSKTDMRFDNVEDHIKITLNGKDYLSDSSFLLTENKRFQAPYNGRYTLDVFYDRPDTSFHRNVIQPTTANQSGTNPDHWEDTIAQNAIIHVLLNSSDTDALWNRAKLEARIRYWSGSLPDTITMWIPGEWEVLHRANCIWANPTYQRLFGVLYNGWGQFAYHPVGSQGGNSLIRPGSLVPTVNSDIIVNGDTTGLRGRINNTVDSIGFAQPTISGFTTAYGSQYSVINDSSCWVSMTADAEHDRWVSYGAQNSIGIDTMSNSIQEEWYSSVSKISADSSAILYVAAGYDDAIPPQMGITPTKAVNKVNRSNNHSYTLGAATLTASYSSGQSCIDMDYLDLNGDRYPDIVGTYFVQYRSQWGGLGDIAVLPHNMNDVTVSTTNSVGSSFGASPVSHERVISGKPAGAKFTLAGDGSGSLNGNLDIGWNRSSSSWTDMNGDGLPDYVNDDGRVRLNTGYDFLPAENWHFDSIHSGQSVSTAVGASNSSSLFTKFNVFQGSLQLGAGLGRSANRTGYTFMDINGDGLPDKVWCDVANLDIANWDYFLDIQDNVHVSFNHGGGEWSGQYDMKIKNFNWSESYNESLNAGLTIGATFFGVFKLTAGVSGTPYSGTVNRDRMQLVDINGDGWPDLVTSNHEDSLCVRYNRGGKTNLLKKVTNFTGSSIYLDYDLSAADYNQPSRSWQLTEVTTKDPLNPNGADTSVTRFSYHKPRYDRLERTFYGYGSVVTNQINPSDNSIYRTTVRDYYNSNILVKGRLKRDTIKDGNNNVYIVKEYHYDYKSYDGGNTDTCSGNAYALCDSIVTKFYEGDSTPKLTSAEIFVYDRYHNVTRYIDKGDMAYSDDGLYAEMTYLTGQALNLVGLRDSYKVYATGATGTNWLRYTTFQYNTYGKLTKQELHETSSTPTYDFQYDAFGNLSKIWTPKNDSLQRMTYEYTYDGYTHTYPTKIVNSHMDEVNTRYIHYFGKPIQVTDPSGSSMHYSYDYAGRLISVTSPLNSHSSTLTNEYYPTRTCVPDVSQPYNPSDHPFAVTKHFDDQGNLITETVVITDGFGRVIQTKKGITTGGQQKLQVSGRMFTDAFGRVTGRHDPFCENRSLSLGTFNMHISTLIDTIEYDVLDREIEIRQPSMNYTTTKAYDVQNDESGRRRFTLEVTDPNNHTTVQYSDYDGRQVQVTDALNGKTLFAYDAVGQLLKATDPEDFATTYQYDNLGRVTARTHPDAGTTHYSYDDAGNITQEVNPLGIIYYDYTYQRLAKKRYSNIPENNVTYTYGGAGSGTGRGRLVSVSDGTGERIFKYDALGNVTTERRTIAVPNTPNVYTFITEYKYDSWGRMRSMTYPDGEIVTYNYDYGGDLLSMYGDKGTEHHDYVLSILYNDFGQRSRINYENNTYAEYIYDALHRLNQLKSTSTSGAMQKIKYNIDGIGNIDGISNDATAVNGLGGPYKNIYGYDGLNRLISSSEVSRNNYSMSMTYSPSGRLSHKAVNIPIVLPTNINMYYGYCIDNQPHAPKRIYDSERLTLNELIWDDAGNLGQVNTVGHYHDNDNNRFLFWTEDNRLHTVADEQCYSYYTYDHAGERTLKLTGTSNLLDINANVMQTASLLDKLTLYPTPYLVLTNHGYTKHYYIGSDRLCARIGGGGLIRATQNSTLVNRASSLFNSCNQLNEERVLHGDPLNCIHGLDWDGDVLRTPLNGMPSSLNASLSINTSDFNSMIAYYSTHSYTEGEVYYYHGDHLGGANWITDVSGHPVQHLQYLPYGENYINKRVAGSTYNERFSFTGKERDEETGYGYFGARYMDHELMTMWLSVDPMSDKYPSMSPYAYCAWNPVKLVDPDGQDVWSVSEDGTVQRTGNDGGARKQTVNYANGTVATFRGNKYHKIMSDLSTKGNNNVSSSFGNENMQTAFAKVFKAMADNTNVEWGIERYTDNTYSIGTKHDKMLTPSAYDLSKGNHSDRDVVTSLHSHPMNGFINPTSIASQIESMGYLNWEGDPLSRRYKGDAENKTKSLKSANYYTYFPHTKQLWCVGYYGPAYIRNIKSFSDFFFGTYNSK